MAKCNKNVTEVNHSLPTSFKIQFNKVTLKSKIPHLSEAISLAYELHKQTLDESHVIAVLPEKSDKLVRCLFCTYELPFDIAQNY